MNHRINRPCGKNLTQQTAIAHVAFEKRRPLARYLLDAVEHLALAVRKIVDHGDIMPRRKKRNAGVRTDETGAAGDEDMHVN